jgi:hypothetical protein
MNTNVNYIIHILYAEQRSTTGRLSTRYNNFDKSICLSDIITFLRMESTRRDSK